MRELLPGVWHWTTPYPKLGGVPVSSYWLANDGVLIDPLVAADDQSDGGDDGLDWFAAQPKPPTAIVLSNRHHYRASDRFAQRFGISVHVPRTGLHEFTDGQPVIGYDPGEHLPGGLEAVEVGVLSPDDSGLYLASLKALWLADTIVRGQRPEDPIGWVIDQLMDDPPQTKRGLLAVFTRLLADYDFEHLLLAHGLPLIGEGRTALQALVDEGGRTAVEAFAA